jgi:hypothetical protein
LVESVGPNSRELANEVEKLSLYVGDRRDIEPGDVAAVVTSQQTGARFRARATLWVDRDLPRLLRTLDEELWTMKFDSAKSEIGLLYGLITKVRTMLFLKEMIREGWIKADMDYKRVQGTTRARPGKPVTGGQALQSAGHESLCPLQGAAAREALRDRGADPGHGIAARL